MLTLVLGGARSGKSRYAQSLIGSREAIYIATARRSDDREMSSRIDRHRADRPPSWTTIEEPESVARTIRTAAPAAAPVIVECVTLWLANLFERESRTPTQQQRDILMTAVRELADSCRVREVIAVTNEVGGGIVPATQTGRRFRDLQGWANQILAAEAQSVVLVVAGLPLVLKGENRTGL
jgi:adenosylcobinamide kinase / adenosylcobinamide-phosphate guanylyltransferase